MPTTILVPLDGSSFSEQALRYAAGIAERAGLASGFRHANQTRLHGRGDVIGSSIANAGEGALDAVFFDDDGRGADGDAVIGFVRNLD